MSYSPEMLAELKATPVWDYDTATAFATKHMQKPRSVVAKIGALGLTYRAKTASGNSTTQAKSAPRANKADLVASLEAKLGIRAPSLDKVNMADLSNILGAITNV